MVTRETGTAAVELLRELLARGTAYRSAIELDHDFDGEEWERRVIPVLTAADVDEIIERHRQ